MKKSYLLSILTLALVSVFTFGVLSKPSEAACRDTSPGTIVRCGLNSWADLRAKYNAKSNWMLRAIYGAYGAKSIDAFSDKSGYTKTEGQLRPNGTIYDKSGKLVAKNARVLMRVKASYAYKKTIAGQTFYEYNYARAPRVSGFNTINNSVFIVMKDGKFLMAIMSRCGNPIAADNMIPAPKPQPKPAATCKAVKVNTFSRTNYSLTTSATVANGAKVSKYYFNVKDSSGKLVYSKTVNSSSLSASTPRFTLNKPGKYAVTTSVATSVGTKGGSQCNATITVGPAPFTAEPGVSIDKKVNNQDENLNVDVNQEFTYQIIVKNTGNVELKNAKVTDKADAGIQLIKASAGTVSGNTWTHTIPALAVGKSATFTITAKVPTYKAGQLVNNVCVDTPTVPNKPGQDNDGCDDVPVTPNEPQKPEPKNPAIDIQKTVNNVEHTTVNVNEEFAYKIVVKNTGDVTLKDVKLTDNAPQGVTFIRADQGTIANNAWTITLDELKVGESKTFTITAKVPEYKAETIKNIVCVDTPTIPNKPGENADDCDDATHDNPTPGDVEVCDVESGKIITVKENEKDNDGYAPVDSPKCEDVEVCDTTTGTIITVKASQKDDEKYAPVDSPKCEDIKVCVIDSKVVDTIKKSEYDESKHTADMSKCEEEPTPETPAPEEPKEMPKTGAGEVITSVLGLGSLVGASYYYLASRRRL